MNFQQYQLTPDELNGILNLAMTNICSSLVDEGLLTLEQATSFMSDHVCLMVTRDSFWHRMKKKLGWELDGGDVPIVLKLAYKINPTTEG